MVLVVFVVVVPTLVVVVSLAIVVSTFCASSAWVKALLTASIIPSLERVAPDTVLTSVDCLDIIAFLIVFQALLKKLSVSLDEYTVISVIFPLEIVTDTFKLGLYPVPVPM